MKTHNTKSFSVLKFEIWILKAIKFLNVFTEIKSLCLLKCHWVLCVGHVYLEYKEIS